MITCFLLTHIPDPKTNKRIAAFKKKGDVSVICTRRKNQDIWDPVCEDVSYNIFDIDLPASKRLISRAIISNRYQKRALRELNILKPDVIYADGLDSLIIASKYKQKKKTIKLFYDVADLREVYIQTPQNIIKKIAIKAIKIREKNCFSVVDYLVVTSPKFFDVYYKKLISEDRTIYIPNAPDRAVFAGYKKKENGKFTIGFIGGIRYLEQMKMLVDAAGECDCDVLFAGAGGTSFEYNQIASYCQDKDWVIFTGKYDYNTQIAALYSSVDCIYAVYNADNPNVRIALPNKLYESVLCELPIIVAKNTYLSELVHEWGVGLSVDHKSVDELKNAILRLKDDKELYQTIEMNCKKTMFNNESDRLIEYI